MFHANTLKFVEWWRGLPRTGRWTTPARAFVEPADLVPVLPQVFILEARLARPTFRLAGGLICDLHGRELRDRPVAPLWDRADQPRIAAALERALAGPEPVIIQADAYALNDARVGLELVFAPLAAGPAGEPDRLIGLYQPTSILARLEGRPIHRLAIRRIHPEHAANDGRLRLVAVDGRRIA
jgi:hypothetical protein